ncbi:MAG: TetR/AcrR family transcriptional regulator [Polyangiales bacterium]
MAHISRLPPGVKQPKKDARAVRTREALRNALLSLLDDKPFEHITVRDITALAGAGYATFFRHYPDKGALLDDLAAAGIRELLERALPILEAEDTRASCLALCGYVDEHRQLWAALLTGGAASTLREEFVRQARVVASSYAGRQTRRDGWLPNDLAVVFGVSGVLELLGWWLQHRGHLTLPQIADIVDRLVIAPILRSP